MNNVIDLMSKKPKPAESNEPLELADFARIFCKSGIEIDHLKISGDDVRISESAFATFSSVLGLAIGQDEAQIAIEDHPRLFAACCIAWLGAVAKLPGADEFLTGVSSDLKEIH